MPRFYFHLYTDSTSCDDEGKEFPDLPAAWQQALTYARDMAAVTVREGYLNLSHRIDVADKAGEVLATLSFRDVVQIKE